MVPQSGATWLYGMVALLNWDAFHGDLQDLLQFTHLPMQVAVNWASRDESIASGTAGLWLALNHHQAFNIDSDEYENQHSIFAASMLVNDDGPHLQATNFNTAGGSAYLGDVFEGACGAFWTAQVLSRIYKFEQVASQAGAVIRPGLAHGSTIRNLYSLFACEIDAMNVVEVLMEEASLARAGWCNGLIGIAAASGMTIAQLGETPELREMTLDLTHRALKQFHVDEAEYDMGLCHGTSGVHVVAIGIARLLGDKNLESTVQESFDRVLVERRIFEYSRDLKVDFSWLTGSAGVLWASKTMANTPFINPLFPPDSLIRGK